MGYHFFTLTAPFLPSANVAIINRSWMTAKRFAAAIGTTEEKLNKHYSKLFVRRVPGCWKWRNLVNINEHARLILKRFWSNEKDIEAAVKQLEKHCLPRPDDVVEKDDEVEEDGKDKEEVIEVEEDDVAVVPKKRTREVEKKNGEDHEHHTQEDAIVKMLRVHTTRIEGMVKQVFEMMEDKAVKAMTSMPEFRNRASKVADDIVAEEVVAKRAAANVAFKAWKEKRQTQLDAELEAEMEKKREQALSVMTLSYNPALAEAVTNRVSERGMQDVDMDVFFAARGK